VKLKLKWIAVGDTEVTTRKYLHPTDFASTHNTTVTINTSFIATTATKAKSTTTAATIKTKGNKAKSLGYVETVFN